MQKSRSRVCDNFVARGDDPDGFFRPYSPESGKIDYRFHERWVQRWSSWISDHGTIDEFRNDHLIRNFVMSEPTFNDTLKATLRIEVKHRGQSTVYVGSGFFVTHRHVITVDHLVPSFHQESSIEFFVNGSNDGYKAKKLFLDGLMDDFVKPVLCRGGPKYPEQYWKLQRR